MGTNEYGVNTQVSLLPAEQPRFDEMQQVVELYIQNVNPTKIAKQVGIRRVDVLAHIEEWRKSAVGSENMKDRVDELIAGMDEHYSMLIQKAYEIIEEVDDLKNDGKETMTRSQMLSQKKGALDLIAKLEKDRIDVLQKSGLLDAADLGDELAAMEEQKQLILEILSDELCDHCKPKVMGRLAGAMNNNSSSQTVVVVSE